MSRIVKYVLLIALCCGILYYALHKNAPKNGSVNAIRSRTAIAVAVEMSPIRKGEITDEGRYTGSVYPYSSFIVSPKISGRLKRLHCNIGDMIEKGFLIAEIEDDEYIQSVLQAEAEVAIAKATLNESKAQLDIARREFERIKAMRAQKVSSESEVETAQALLDTRLARHEINKASLSQKEAMLKLSRIRLSYTRIEASWNGSARFRHVGEKFQDEGAMLSQNSQIISVIDIHKVIIAIDVTEKDYYKIKIGQETVINTQGLPDKIFRGRVIRIAPLLNSATRQARIEVEVENEDFNLKPGMFVTARLEYETRHNVTIVPISAIARRNDVAGVFFIDRDKSVSKFIPVETGIQTNENVEIASPTIEGEVVTLGQHLLENGSPVILPDSQEKQGETSQKEPSKHDDSSKGMSKGANRK